MLYLKIYRIVIIRSRDRDNRDIGTEIEIKNRFKTGKYIFFYTGKFKKIKYRYLSFQKSI